MRQYVSGYKHVSAASAYLEVLSHDKQDVLGCLECFRLGDA